MKIGHIELNQAIALAPMEDVTDIPFRLICKRLGADLVYTEFTSSEAIIRDIPKALRKIQVVDEERPVGIQIFGGVEESMEQAAKIAESFGPDIIDINCGCWSKTHALRGEGAGLLKDLKQFENIVKTTVKATRLPVTVKTRLGWDDKSIVILDVAKMVEQAGAKALTIHCRTRCQGYKGAADWGWLSKIKKAINIPLIGNGDIETPMDVKRMLETGCDGVMIGRGALANPWIFAQAKYFLAKGTLPPPVSLRERIELCLEHLDLSVKQRGLPHGIITFRKYYTGYLSGLPYISKLRAELMKLTDVKAIAETLHHYLDHPAAHEAVSS